MEYVAFKTFVAHAISSDSADAFAHFHGGMVIFLVARLITGRPLSSLVLLACVCGIQLLNELIDFLNHSAWRWSDTLADTYNTLLWPIIIFVTLQFRGQRD